MNIHVERTSMSQQAFLWCMVTLLITFITLTHTRFKNIFRTMKLQISVTAQKISAAAGKLRTKVTSKIAFQLCEIMFVYSFRLLPSESQYYRLFYIRLHFGVREYLLDRSLWIVVCETVDHKWNHFGSTSNALRHNQLNTTNSSWLFRCVLLICKRKLMRPCCQHQLGIQQISVGQAFIRTPSDPGIRWRMAYFLVFAVMFVDKIS